MQTNELLEGFRTIMKETGESADSVGTRVAQNPHIVARLERRQAYEKRLTEKVAAELERLEELKEEHRNNG